jgi:arylsulfatase A-like enzyme
MAAPLLATQANRPSILFIQTEDQRFDDLGCCGNWTIPLNHFVATAICCCSRASILTGQHMRRHGVRDFATPASAAQLAETYPTSCRGSVSETDSSRN